MVWLSLLTSTLLIRTQMHQVKKLLNGDVLVGDVFLPSLETIRSRCAQIQGTWSPEEALERRAGPTGHVAWEVPRVIECEFE